MFYLDRPWLRLDWPNPVKEWDYLHYLHRITKNKTWHNHIVPDNPVSKRSYNSSGRRIAFLKKKIVHTLRGQSSRSVGWHIIIHHGGEKSRKSRSASLEIDVMATTKPLPTLQNIKQNTNNKKMLYICMFILCWLIMKLRFYCYVQIVLKSPARNEEKKAAIHL